MAWPSCSRHRNISVDSSTRQLMSECYAHVGKLKRGHSTKLVKGAPKLLALIAPCS